MIIPKDVRHLNRSELQQYVINIFEAYGCTIERVGQTSDGEIGLIIHKNGERGVVQCKQYPSGQEVGSTTVRDLKRIMAQEGAQLGFLLTTSTFTPQAYSEAAYAPRVTLFDANKLSGLSEESKVVQSGGQSESRIDHQFDYQRSAVSNVQTQQRLGCRRSFEVVFGAALGWFTALGAAGVIVAMGIVLLSVVCCILGGLALAGAGA